MLIRALGEHKPCSKAFNSSDLADPMFEESRETLKDVAHGVGLAELNRTRLYCMRLFGLSRRRWAGGLDAREHSRLIFIIQCCEFGGLSRR